jgi:hypothetical protein
VARIEALVANTPLKRFGMPDEVAAIAVMLTLDEVTYITGTEVTIDGGLLAGSAATSEEGRGRRSRLNTLQYAHTCCHVVV